MAIFRNFAASLLQLQSTVYGALVSRSNRASILSCCAPPESNRKHGRIQIMTCPVYLMSLNIPDFKISTPIPYQILINVCPVLASEI